MAPKRSSMRKEALISPIPGAVANLRHIRSLQAEIDLVTVQQQQAQASLDLDIQVAQARSNAIKSLFDLDAAAENLRRAFQKK